MAKKRRTLERIIDKCLFSFQISTRAQISFFQSVLYSGLSHESEAKQRCTLTTGTPC